MKNVKTRSLGFLIGVFVLKRNEMRPPTPLDQVSAQLDKFYQVIVHEESKSVLSQQLIAVIWLNKNAQKCKMSKKSWERVGDVS